MGRAPCCDKANVKKGPWSPEEDAKLKSYIEQHGTGGNWIALPQKIGLKRCGKSCRLRWLNYLRPNLKHGGFSEEEDNIICSLYVSIGSRWSVIAAQLPGRTDNDIKNYWNTRLKKKLFGKYRKELQQARNRGNNSVKKETGNGGSIEEYSLSSLVPENSTQQQQQHYWPSQIPLLPPPWPHTNQGPCFNDQDSIKKLLIKLGGRFSEDDYHPALDAMNHQFSDGTSSSTQQNYEEQVHMASNSACINVNAVNNNEVKFEDQYCAEGAAGLDDLVQGQTSFSAAIEGIMVSSNNYPLRLDNGMEFFYGEGDMVNDKMLGSSTSCSPAVINWGGTETGTSTLIYPPLAASSNYQDKTPQECTLQLQELSYPGAQ